MKKYAFRLNNTREFDVVLDSVKSCGLIELNETDKAGLKRFWGVCKEENLPFFFELNNGHLSVTLLEQSTDLGVDMELVGPFTDWYGDSLPSITWKEFAEKEYGKGESPTLRSKEEILLNLQQI